MLGNGGVVFVTLVGFGGSDVLILGFGGPVVESGAMILGYDFWVWAGTGRVWGLTGWTFGLGELRWGMGDWVLQL